MEGDEGARLKVLTGGGGGRSNTNTTTHALFQQIVVRGKQNTFLRNLFANTADKQRREGQGKRTAL